jgi:hypothetical protein
VTDHERTQPQAVSKPLENYLNMTAPRTSAPRRRRRQRGERRPDTRPLIDNRGLTLEEGNDFA